MKVFVDIHTHNRLSGSTKVLNFRLGVEPQPTERPFSAGIHPWDILSINAPLDSLFEQLKLVDCVAIGEIGLDKCCATPMELQQEAFSLQLSIAEKRQLPVIIHCVKAHNEALEILSKYKLNGVVFHGFIGSQRLCQQLVTQGYYISFGFSALRSPKTIEALRHCPLERLFLESDTKEQDIAELYTMVASIKEITTEELQEILHNNYKTLFHNELAREN